MDGALDEDEAMDVCPDGFVRLLEGRARLDAPRE
jgi:hypothetical protein